MSFFAVGKSRGSVKSRPDKLIRIKLRRVSPSRRRLSVRTMTIHKRNTGRREWIAVIDADPMDNISSKAYLNN